MEKLWCVYFLRVGFDVLTSFLLDLRMKLGMRFLYNGDKESLVFANECLMELLTP
jgi:hypothetical protein